MNPAELLNRMPSRSRSPVVNGSSVEFLESMLVLLFTIVDIDLKNMSLTTTTWQFV